MYPRLVSNYGAEVGLELLILLASVGTFICVHIPT